MPTKDSGRGTRRKILLVDDSEAHVRLLEEALRALHVSVAIQVAVDGEEALRWLTSAELDGELPDLVLLDINMPKVSGLDVLRVIRTTPPLRLIPVIILSSSKDEAEVNAAYALGANAYVWKPVDNFFDMVADVDRFWLQRALLPHPQPKMQEQ